MPQIYNSTGTAIYYWRVGKFSSRKLLPLNVRGIAHPGVAVSSRETTHLLSTIPDGSNEFGGRTFAPGELGDPQSLSITAFADYSVIMPKGMFHVQLVFPLLPGWKIRARWLGLGFFTLHGGFNINDVDTNAETTMEVKLSGVFTVSPAKRVA